LSKKNSQLKQTVVNKLPSQKSCDHEVKQRTDDTEHPTKLTDDKKKSRKIPTIKELRSDNVVSKKADKIKKSFLLDFSDSSTSDSDKEEVNTETSGTQFYEPFSNKKSKKVISDEARASKDRVKLDVPWPHEFAQNVSVNYSDREFGLIQLVHGEIYILSNVETVFSKDRQLHLLNLLYLAEKFPIVEIKAYHAEVLRSIERGMKSWNDSFADEKYRTLLTPNTNMMDHDNQL